MQFNRGGQVFGRVASIATLHGPVPALWSDESPRFSEDENAALDSLLPFALETLADR